MTVTNTLIGGTSVETTEVTGNDGRSHWVERFVNEAGDQTGLRVLHPFGTEPAQCNLAKGATWGDAIGCVETFGTERHP